MHRRSLLTTLLSAIVALAVLAAPAAANPPAGDWTFLRKDAFRHYACKVAAKDGTWRIDTATFLNGRDDAVRHGIGAYAALARGGNDDRDLVAQRTSTNWRGGYVRMSLRGARAGDRLWLQGAYYGPAEPWSDGTPVADIARCAGKAGR